MTSNETTITTNFKVSGLKSLIEAKEAYIQLKQAASGNISGGFAGSMNKDIEKAQAGVRKLSEMIKSAGQSGSTTNQFSKMHNDINSSAEAAEKLGSKMRQAGSYGGSFAEAQGKAASASSKAAEAAQKASNAQRNANSAMSSTAASAGRVASESSKAESSWSKLKGSVKDTFAMFSVGMLAMNGVNAAVEGVKSAFKGGYDTIKEQQSGQAMWSTSIQDAHPNLTKAQLRSQSAAANAAMTSTAIKAGNDYTQANSMAKQVYSSDAGEYSGNLAKTRSLVTGMFNIQDANALNEMEMQRFTTAVGNIGDTGKMSGAIAKSLNFLDGKMTRRMRDEYKLETGKTLAKTKQGNWDYSQISAQMAYRALDKYGNSGGVGEASKNINSTLGGVTRAGKSAINLGMARFETSFANQINKAFGGKSGLIGKLSAVFTNSDLINKIADKAAVKLSKLAVDIGKFGKGAVSVAKDIAPYAKEFGGSFVKGFSKEIKDIGYAVQDAYKYVSGVAEKLGGKLSKLVPKNALSDIGGAAGKITAAVVAFRGINKIPGVSKLTSAAFRPAIEVLSRIPLIGKLVSPITKLLGINTKTEDSAAAKMMTASDKMNVAADKFGKGTGTGGGYSDPLSDYNGLGGLNYNKTGKLVDQVYEPGVTTRSSLRADAKFQASRAGQWINKGEEMINGVGRHGSTSMISKIAGKGLVGLGTIGKDVSETFRPLTSIAGKAGVALKGAKGFISKGMPGMNALFAGLDVVSTLSTTKAGSLARHKGVGNAVGGGVGATLGAALGSFAGPLGTIAGGMAGQWAGGKIGSWIGSTFGGTKAKKKSPSKTAAQYAQAAENRVALNNQAQAIVTGGGAKTKAIAKKQITAIGNARQTKSKSAQTFAAQAQSSLDSGDYKSYQKQTAQAAQATAKYYTKRADTAKNAAKSDKETYTKAKKYMEKAQKAGDYSEAYKQEKKYEKYKEKYKSNKSKSSSATKKANKADKLSTSLGNKSVKTQEARKKKLDGLRIDPKWAKTHKVDDNGSKKGAKSAKGAGKEADKASKKNKKVGDSAKKSSKKASDSLKTLTKAQKKELNKQTSALKKANKKQASQVKSANAKVKAAQKKAAKDIAKADKAASKAMSKNYKTSSKEISKALKSGMKKAATAAKSGAKKIGSNIKSGLKNVPKNAKSSFKSFNKDIKSGMKKAQSAAKSGSKKIGTGVKSGLKNVPKAAKSAFKSLSKDVKSGLRTAQSAAKSGSKKISSNVKSGLKSVGKLGKSQFRSLTNSVKSGLRSSASAARSGARKIGTSVKSGLSTVKTAGRSAFKGLTSTVKSGLNQAKSAARSGGKAVSNAVKSGLSSMASNARGQFNKLSSAAKSGMAKVTSSVKSGIAKANSTMSAGFSKMVSTARRATSRISSSMSKIGTSASSAASKVRTLQSAINGLKSKTVTITANVKGKGSNKLATGTPGARATFARLATGTPGFHLAGGWAKNGGVKTGTYMVNDSKSSHWQEAFQTADGLIGIFPPVRDLLVHLREGDQVLNGDDTHKMYPRLKNGTPAAKQAMMRQAPAPAKAPVINVTVNLNGGQYNEKTIPAKIADAIANIVGEKFKQLFPEAPI